MIRYFAIGILLLFPSPALADDSFPGGIPDEPAHIDAQGIEQGTGSATGFAGAGDLTYPSIKQCPAILIQQPHIRSSQSAYDRSIMMTIACSWKYARKGPYAVLEIDTNGTCCSVKILRSAGKTLDSDATKLAQSLQYCPPDCRKTSEPVRVRIHFNQLDRYSP